MYGAMQDAAANEDPSKSDNCLGSLELQEETGDVEEQRPLKLIGQVGADPWLNGRPRVAPVCSTPQTPYDRSPRDGKQGVQEPGERYMRCHWHNQSLRHGSVPPN